MIPPRMRHVWSNERLSMMGQLEIADGERLVRLLVFLVVLGISNALSMPSGAGSASKPLFRKLNAARGSAARLGGQWGVANSQTGPIRTF
jgi:hypothetical protein